MQPLDRDSNTHARAQVLAVFSRARRVGKKGGKKGRTDRTNREQIAKTTNFHWPDRQRQINAKSECTDLEEGGDGGGGGVEMEKSFCTVAGMSWLSSSAVHAARKRRHQRPLNQTSEWKPLRARDEFAVIGVSPSVPCCAAVTPFHISLG